MGKISNAIMMLEYLNTGNKYTARELSEKIGVSEGMIKYYKNELEESGIRIETFKGPNGGYFLLNNKKPYN
ncbi:MAG: HTH domain-containing protein, partial [Bacilli bacterium]